MTTLPAAPSNATVTSRIESSDAPNVSDLGADSGEAVCGGRTWLLPAPAADFPSVPKRCRFGPAQVLAASLAALALSGGLRGGELEAEGDVVRLDPYEVADKRVESQDYRSDQTVTATRTDTPLSDVPQSITVVTEQQIRDQQMLSLEDAARYVPGLSVHQGENNRDQLIFRGTSSSADFFLDGVRDDVQYFRDVYNLSRIEVLLGPDAMIFGRGGGGGVINRVTKQAGFQPFREMAFAAGSYGERRVALDVNQPLDPSVAARFNGIYEAAGSFRHGVSLEHYAVNPTFTLVPGPQTRITLGYEFAHDRRTADRGIPSYLGRPVDVPVSRYYGDPADSHVRSNVSLVSAVVEHQAGALTLRNHSTFGVYDRGYQNFVPGAVSADQTQVALTAYNNATVRQNLFNQTDAVYVTDAGGLRQTLLGGAEFGRQLTNNLRHTGYFNNTATSILVPYDDPDVAAPVTFRQSATDANNHMVVNLAAAYFQDQVEFNPHLQAIGGLRFDSFALSYHDNRAGTDLARTDELVSPRIGLIVKPVAALSLYGSLGVSYLPSSGDQFSSLTTVTQQVKPEKFTNHEVGAKWAATPKLTLSAALYSLDRTNTRATDPNDPTRIIQTGRTRTNGLEVGVSGQVTSGWTISGGYAWQDARITAATTAAAAGAQVASVPHHNLALWNKVQVTRQFGLGLGVIGRTAMFAAVDNQVVLPGYARVDAAFFWAPTDRWRLQANVENLLNRRYIADADSNTNISPGSPLAVRVAWRTSF